MDQRKRAKSREECKIRVLAIERIINRGGKVTARQIQKELKEKYDMHVCPKTILMDINAIDRFIPIESTVGQHGGYQRINVLGRGEDGNPKN